MPFDADDARFALVVPDVELNEALDVPKRIRELLRIEVYSVAEDWTGRFRNSSGLLPRHSEEVRRGALAPRWTVSLATPRLAATPGRLDPCS
jgi:hypothetical protein